ncbi:DUF6191 domain-containing protein [Streptomyces sp. SH5]|uniref:DUF6191 domain-containing protein n=1 Tax=Streptomyces sp. SH5 TaxID=3041765 RepID=UPI0032B02C02
MSEGARPVFNFFEELFAPGRGHTSDERKRLELSRVDAGIGDPHRDRWTWPRGRSPCVPRARRARPRGTVLPGPGTGAYGRCRPSRTPCSTGPGPESR